MCFSINGNIFANLIFVSSGIVMLNVSLVILNRSANLGLFFFRGIMLKVNAAFPSCEYTNIVQ